MPEVININPDKKQKTTDDGLSRRCSAYKCAPYKPLPDSFELDHKLHAKLAKLTGGISPIALALSGFDWWAHLMFSPAKQQMLGKSMFEKARKMSGYLAQAAQASNPEPIITPESNDRRFQSDAWKSWPFNVLAQNFLLTQSWWDKATSGVRGTSEHHSNVASFTARQILDIFSPSNNPFTNPDILQTTKAEGGKNFWQGYQNLLEDAKRHQEGKPPVGSEAFEVGKNIAATKGKVVFRNNLIELIQYTPTTAEVYAEPVLITPAWIMKYYILDLSPKNSMVKYLVDKGHTVFMISWKNPDENDRDLGLDDYLHTGLGEAIDAVKAITKAPQINAVGYCLGGTLLSIMAASHARDGDESFKTITLLASQVDFEDAGEIMLFTDESQIAFLEDVMWNQGYLDKQHMAGAFALLRSNDLIWSRIIKNYMQGKRESMFDLMAWNADATRLPYRMHSEYLQQLFMKNELAEGHFIVGDAPVALTDIRAPIFSVGTQRDHVAPWKSVYKILLLTESEVTFVLASGGHNAGIVSEPGHKGRSYQMETIPSTARYVPSGRWKKDTPEKQGSWWEAWDAWLAENSVGKAKPPTIGNANGYKPIADAPGNYVLIK
ncbi:alpha/beta fold hydrolase [Rickettsiales bacterium]|nr:alpha/beta fold hydrolase [Rickettsiales bacterium]